MARREGTPLHGSRYCEDKAKKVLHDLDNEKTQCQIDEIIAAGNAVPVLLTRESRRLGYVLCEYCFNGCVW